MERRRYSCARRKSICNGEWTFSSHEESSAEVEYNHACRVGARLRGMRGDLPLATPRLHLLTYFDIPSMQTLAKEELTAARLIQTLLASSTNFEAREWSKDTTRRTRRAGDVVQIFALFFLLRSICDRTQTHVAPENKPRTNFHGSCEVPVDLYRNRTLESWFPYLPEEGKQEPRYDILLEPAFQKPDAIDAHDCFESVSRFP